MSATVEYSLPSAFLHDVACQRDPVRPHQPSSPRAPSLPCAPVSARTAVTPERPCRGRESRGCSSAQHGFTYIGVLILVALAGVALAGAGELWSTASRRDKEAQLLFVGDEFRRAIGSYYESSPGTKQFPQRLEELLEDRRLPVVRRHLRRIYVDPMTGKPEWGLVKRGDRIAGIHSPSEERPLKIANFRPEDDAFKGSGAYADWRFVYEPQGNQPAPPTPRAAASLQPGASSPVKVP